MNNRASGMVRHPFGDGVMGETKVNILLVDDKPEKLLALEAVLEDLGENLVRTTSGREALRHLLQEEFAVILLDVNMPGMDGFETASLIRQRQSSRDTPIIFITAFADEMHLSRGYELGAVDYIMAPVIPDVLRTKVRVFVELFRQKRELSRQAEIQRRRASQLQKLAAAALAINASRSLPALLRTVAEGARDIIDAHQAVIHVLPPGGAAGGKNRGETVGSFSQRYGQWGDKPLRLLRGGDTSIVRGCGPVRLDDSALRRHADWPIISRFDAPALRGILAAPLTTAARPLGLIYLSDRRDGDFTDEDETILTQLAQMASVAIENALFLEEREVNRLKDEFLATLSHELRTPLNAILGWTHLLRAGMPGDGEAAHGLEVIERNVKAQTRLIEDLLDVSRITTGKLRLSVRPMSPAAVIEAAIDSLRPAADGKNIAIEARIPIDLGEIVGDPDRLQQVVWNLLSNAIKFTPSHGRVKVEVDRSADRVGVRVIDDGKGIDPTFLPYVFERFRQADSSTTRSHGGLGLGLTIVRHLVELHGGSVQAESEGEGKGATFTVALPIRAAMPPSQLQPRARNGDSAPTSAAKRIPDFYGLRILAVDDEPDARELINAILAQTRAHIEIAEGARQAIALIDRQPPDILVSDIGMPEEDGYALIREVRRRTPDRGGKVPAIALTAYVREEDRARMLEAGFTAHVPKPVEADELIRVIDNISGRALGPRTQPESA